MYLTVKHADPDGSSGNPDGKFWMNKGFQRIPFLHLYLGGSFGSISDRILGARNAAKNFRPSA
jgi:hypothetical protein